MESEDDDLVYFVKDLSGSRTIAYKNNDSIHLVGDNKRLAYCCKYNNSNEMKWTDRDKFRPMNSTPKMSFLHVLERLWQIVATNPLNIVQETYVDKRNSQNQQGTRLSSWPRGNEFVRGDYACI